MPTIVCEGGVRRSAPNSLLSSRAATAASAGPIEIRRATDKPTAACLASGGGAARSCTVARAPRTARKSSFATFWMLIASRAEFGYLLFDAQRFSWRDPSNILFFCRVRNVSAHRLGVAGLCARALPLARSHQRLQARECVAGAEPLQLSADNATEGGESPGALVPLVPFRGVDVDGSNTSDTAVDNNQFCQRIVRPKEELLLLYAAQNTKQLEHLTRESGYVAPIETNFVVENASGET